MKKLSVVPIILLISYMLTSITANANNNRPGQSTAAFTQLPHTVYYVDNDNYNKKKLENIQASVNLMPEYLLDYFRQEGVKVYFNENVPAAERVDQRGILYDACCVEPTVSYNQTTLEIYAVSIRPHIYVYDNVADYIIIHEYGHAYDMIAGYITGTYKGDYGISGQDQWKTLYDKNKKALKSIDAYTEANVGVSKREAFAEAFRLYFLKPKTLKSKCPDVYHFIEDTLQRYRIYLKPITSDNFDAEAYLYTYPEVANKVKDTDSKMLWNYYCQKGKALGHKAVCKIPKN